MPWTGKRRNFESRHCYAIRVIYSGIMDKPDAIHMRDRSAIRTRGLPTVEAEFPENGVIGKFIFGS
jgi:hypothetical protein